MIVVQISADEVLAFETMDEAITSLTNDSQFSVGRVTIDKVSFFLQKEVLYNGVQHMTETRLLIYPCLDTDYLDTDY